MHERWDFLLSIYWIASIKGHLVATSKQFTEYDDGNYNAVLRLHLWLDLEHTIDSNISRYSDCIVANFM